MLTQIKSRYQRLISIWLLVLSSSLPSVLLAQVNVLDKKISIDVRDANLVKLLQVISETSGVHFSYNPRKLESPKKIDYKTENKTVREILADLSRNFSFKYELLEDQIIVTPDKKVEKAEIKTATLSGTITDAKTGEALIGTSVYVQELGTGTTANAFGFYSLTVPKGIYNVTTTFIGYENVTSTIDLSASVQQNVALAEQPPVLEEVVIQSTNALDAVREIKASSLNIRSQTVEERPAFFGELDVLKSLESVPGIKLHSDGSTFYYVRGGNRDQNMIMVDDAPIYNPSHILGVFSTVMPDVVNDMTLYKGDMPASLGGRISSVLDVRTKKGNDQHTQVWGSVNLISTKIGVEGPFKKNASSYLVSARISKVKWFFSRLDDQIRKFNFYDLTAKTNVRWNKSNHLYFSFYNGADHFIRGDQGISWTNLASTLRWNHIFNDKLFLNTTLAGSGYDYYLHRSVANNVRWNSHISNFSIKNDFSYFVNNNNDITFGLALTAYAFNPGNLQANREIPKSLTTSVKNSVELVTYANHEFEIAERLGVSYGFRLTNWSNTGEAFEFVLDENRNPVDTLVFPKGEKYVEYSTLEPRLTVNYRLHENASVKTSFSRNVQNIHLISNSVSPFTSLEVWLPSSINIKPQKANQATIGYYHHLTRSGTTLTAEVFYKKMFNQIEYNPHAETLLNPLIESELRFGTGRAYGFELLAKKDEGRLRGWAGYSYARSKREFPDINNGKTFNAFSDRPHQLNLMASYDLSLRWNVGVNWFYSTGAPYSAPVSFFEFHGEEVPVYGQKNNARLPDYHRLDLSANFRLNRKIQNTFVHHLSFSIFNVYGRKNALFINYNKTLTEDNDLLIPSDVTDAERLTSQMYLFRFAPSIAYTFKWL